MLSELKFALNCIGSSKRPVHRNRAVAASRNDDFVDESFGGIQVPLNGLYSSQLAKHKRNLEREVYA